jgi:aldehyde:ferredoxin oxidoreductase
MGSKKIKGVGVRGKNPPELADPEKVRSMARTLVDRVMEGNRLHDYGTGVVMDAGAVMGNLPTHNFRDGNWPHAAKIDAVAIKEKYRVGMGTCYSCAVRCKKEVELTEPYIVERRYGGPEYETLAALGSDCGVSDLAAICKANELCQIYGVDTIGLGATIAFAMECYEEGIIDDEITGGIKLTFGNAEAMLKFTELICKREGFGDILAEGTKRASEILGEKSKKYLKPFGVYDEVPIENLGLEKAHLYKNQMQMRILANCLTICQFPPWRFTEYLDLVQAVTGWDVTMHELVQVAERTLTLAKIFNLNAGFTRKDDWLPDRFFQPQTSGALSETSVNPDELSNAITGFYEMMGWDNEGVPNNGTLHRLSIGWASKYL